MNLIIFDDVASSIFKLRMYPYFDIANYILMSISVKEDTPQSGSVSFSRRHPFSCWLATMLMCFGGAILSSFITGSPLFECFDDTVSVLTATIVWYLINYFPFDLIYRFCKILPVRLLVCSLKEVQRAKKISIGIHHGLHLFPKSPVMCVLLGLLKGVGSLYMHPVSNYILGIWEMKNNPFLNINFTTKISLLAAIVYYCHHLDLIPLPENQLFLVIMGLFVYLRITMILLGLKDPFVPFENAVCKLLFGGTVDAIRSAFERSRSMTSETMPPNTSNLSGTTSSTTSGNANLSSTGTGPAPTSQGLPNSNANSVNSSGLRDTANRQPPSPSDKKRD
ncbi:Trimeric intracellular cation channel type 1B isoform 2 [Schistosoma japonicum]|uniref:Trimeric intracellular cation channel type 1B isoform 2 n=2 Tax=Schistosoma japonicum TaxID=6182 RepID=A0A4Z2DTT6_SCHJA|nr:Trimeric intracellular cation channel type 1B isoform 2 [Schistosoma japonicum]